MIILLSQTRKHNLRSRVFVCAHNIDEGKTTNSRQTLPAKPRFLPECPPDSEVCTEREEREPVGLELRVVRESTFPEWEPFSLGHKKVCVYD